MKDRLTLPIETGIDEQIRELIERLGADAVRNSDGTELPDWVSEGITKVYSTYFPARGDEAWAELAPSERVRQYLMSTPVTSTSSDPLEINVMRDYFSAQFAPDLDLDLARYWQIIDRTTGRTLDPNEWTVRSCDPIPLDNPVRKVGEVPVDAHSALVTIESPEPFHVYTVDFLARQIWDSTQIYNYLTNDWADEPHRVKERPYDVSYPATWKHVQQALKLWLADHPEVNVVRFTTFFYHFTLVFNNRAQEKYVDWFGYSAAVSVPALEDFEREYGYQLLPEDFVDSGHYNSPFRTPSKRFMDWLDFTSRRVAERAQKMVSAVHDSGREAMMFLGDNWIGLEPYGKYFPSIEMDAVVGSVGSAATCRMIADVPGVRYTEGRFLPYFFPDVFNPEGDPLGEANDSWLTARRAIVRSPLDRIGYGGYLSLALQFPAFIDRVEEIVTEFRSLHELSGKTKPANMKPKVAVLNAWGALRTWQTHMVAHALWYKRIYSYQGVIEALAGLPLDVHFISFEDVLNTDGDVLADIDVLLNVGSRDTAFSGGKAWNDPRLQQLVREFVWNGGGLVGIGEPTARTSDSGPLFALTDVLGVDREIDWTLSHTRHSPSDSRTSHFILEDMPSDFDFGEDPGDIIALGQKTEVLIRTEGSVRVATNDYGSGRAVYLAGLPYSAENSRLLQRAVTWAARDEDQWDGAYITDNPQVEVAYYPEVNRCFVYNGSKEAQKAAVRGPAGSFDIQLPAMASEWVDL